MNIIKNGLLLCAISTLSACASGPVTKPYYGYYPLYAGINTKNAKHVVTYISSKPGKIVEPRFFTVTSGQPVLFDAERRSFDYKKYDSDLEEALLNSNVQRANLVGALIPVLSYCKDLADRNNKQVSDYSDALYDKYIVPYYAGTDNLTIAPVIVDHSGFYKDDLSSTDLAKTVLLTSTQLQKFSYGTVDYAPDFYVYITEYLDELAKQKDVCLSKSRSDSNKIAASAAEYETSIKSQTSAYPVKFNNHMTRNDYNLEISGENSFKRVPTQGKQNVPVTFTVLSKNFNTVYPKFNNHDNGIDLSFNGSGIVITNKTKVFVQIKSVSVYYNNKIYNLAGNDIENIFELAPEALVEKDLSQLLASSNLGKLAEYNEMTAQKAKQMHIDFGFAIKYRMVEQNVDKTLYNTKKYVLYDVLKSM